MYASVVGGGEVQDPTPRCDWLHRPRFVESLAFVLGALVSSFRRRFEESLNAVYKVVVNGGGLFMLLLASGRTGSLLLFFISFGYVFP